jgi:hypothetical protein
MRRRAKIAVASAALAIAAGAAGLVLAAARSNATAPKPTYLFDDSHVHLTNYIQEGTNIHDMLRMMGDKVGRAVLFGIPLQQMWSARLDKTAPTYYLETDAPLYYYSFTDAAIAMAYLSLNDRDRARFDPMITGFNPADMYAADHVRRVLETFPGVFEGIGEFSIHKEFVTSKVAGDPPSLDDPALDRLLRFAEEAGLVVLVHCDVDVPFPKPGSEPEYFEGVVALFKRHPHTTIIWAHLGVGRVVRPIKDHAAHFESMIADPALAHVAFDLSWTETAKYIVASPESIQIVARLITRHPERFLFGTDEVAPTDQQEYLRVYRQYQPLWDQLSPEVLHQVLEGNYERIFDGARKRVRAWEQLHVKPAVECQPVARQNK